MTETLTIYPKCFDDISVKTARKISAQFLQCLDLLVPKIIEL